MTSIKNILLSAAAATTIFSACEKSVYPGDDFGKDECMPNQLVVETCDRIDKHTLQISFRVAQTLQWWCDPSVSIPLRFDLHAPNNWVSSFKITGPQGKVRDDKNDEHEVKDLTYQLFSWTVKLNDENAIPEINGLTKDEHGQEVVFDDDQISGCPYIPPCENQLTDHCSYINPYNHCQWATTYTFDLCEPTSLTMKFSTNGFGLAKINSQTYYNITWTIHHPNGMITQTISNPTQYTTLTLQPWDKLSVSYGSNAVLQHSNWSPINWSTQLTIFNFQNAQVPEHIVTPLHDKC
jgi:hypothetical protein